jgi:hypothetical protein
MHNLSILPNRADLSIFTDNLNSDPNSYLGIGIVLELTLARHKK